jgi:choline dehydrogenase-like flavoprotein
MSKLFMPEVSAEQRKLLLQQNADSIEQTDYLKPLSPDELDIKREILTENAIKLSELEDEKKEAMQEFKSQMDPLAKANKELLTEIKTRQAKFFGHLYHMANHEDGMMETYDDNGELVASRRLRPEERRQNLFALPKAANQ